MIRLLPLLMILASCTPTPTNGKECKQALKEVAASNLKDCTEAIDKVVAVYKAACAVRPPAASDELQVLEYWVNPPVCECDDPAKAVYTDPQCRRVFCQGSLFTKVKVKNDNPAKQWQREIHVECIYYDMDATTMYLLRHQEFFKPTLGSTHTVHAFSVNLPSPVVRSLKKGTTIGVECSIVQHPRQPVDAVGKLPGTVAKKPRKVVP